MTMTSKDLSKYLVSKKSMNEENSVMVKDSVYQETQYMDSPQ